jgi:ribonuclease HI
MNIPNAVKVFIWRSCSNALATRSNLFKRRIVLDPICSLCGVEEETIGHALWGCPAAKAVWSLCPGRIQKRSFESDEFTKIVEYIMGCLDIPEVEFFMVVARQIWFRRNAFIFSSPLPSVSSLVKSASESLQAFQGANSSSFPLTFVTPSIVPHWCAPPIGFVKLNWDAAWDGVRNRMGIGIVVRNHLGEVLNSYYSQKGYTSAPDIAEATAALRAARLCHELRLNKVILEGDALQIVRALNSDAPHWSRYGHITEEARGWLSSLVSCEVVHVRRQCNGVAHCLAKLGLSMGEEVLLQGAIPDCVELVVSKERCT